MQHLRIVFMGTPDFAVATLKELIANKCNVVGVITAPDKPAGRGRKLNQSAVKKYAVAQNLTVLQPTNLKSDAFLAELKALEPDLQIVVAFRMLPKVVWQLPKLGTFNLHASLLPEYRGAAPINWAVINGETESGVTTFFINEKIDTGEIILQEKVDIKEQDSARDLHDKLMEIGSKLVVQTVSDIADDSITTVKQPEKDEKPAPKIFKDTCKLNWNDSLTDIYNKIRGLSPYPAAWTTLINGDKETELKIYATSKVKEQHFHENGTIITEKNKLKIAATGGFIEVLELQISGKRKMKINDFLNGFTFTNNAKVL